MAEKRSDFTVEASHSTDIWRKAPNTNRFDAPHQLQPAFPLRQFSSARVTFKGVWEHRYDQAGILVCFSGQNPDDTDPAKNSWIKAGIEYFNGAPHISFVGCDRFADWSLHPVEYGQSDKVTAGPSDYVTIELRRQGDEHGSAIWAYQLLLGEGGQVVEEFPIRECAWPYAYEDCAIQIGAYAARPAPDTASTKKKLVAQFRELMILKV